MSTLIARHRPLRHLDAADARIPRFDATDARILDELQINAKLTNVELAERVNLSPSPCLVRVRALERDGIISRYVTLLDPLALGLSANAFINISLKTQTKCALDNFETAINAYPEVMECYLMSGDSDYLLRVVVSDIQALQSLLDKLTQIPGIANVRSSFALKSVRYETALPVRKDDDSCR